MIISRKQNISLRPQPAYEFDNFLKIRSQKQSIIQSDYQTITQKVQGFQDLLKLTKTGSSISTQIFQKKHPSSQIKNKNQSSKTINVIGACSNQHEINKFDDVVQSDQTQMKKLNKMVYGITEWEYDKQKQSFHAQRKINYQKTSKGSKRKNNQFNIRDKSQQQKIEERRLHAYTSAEGKKFRKFYTPFSKQQAKRQLDKINSRFVKTSSNINYPKALLQNNLFEQSDNKFKQLKRKIKQLQNKARKEYGLKFEYKQQVKKEKIFNDSNENSEEKQNEEYDFADLELGPILAKQFPNKYKSYNKMLEQQNILGTDSSIPKNLIDIVKNKGQSYHQFSLANTKFGYCDILSRNKMKKKYRQRPKSFKPTYTYIRI